MFPDLPPFRGDAERFLTVAQPSRDRDTADQQRQSTDTNGSEAAGWPFFGQFIAHDITADRSPLVGHSVAAPPVNARTPCLDLEVLYGGGPVGSPYLFDRWSPGRLLVDESGDDVLRNRQGMAMIGDPRNDSHVIISQLHLAFVRAHNGLVGRLRADGVPEEELFTAARRAFIWHYQWIVVEDFLPRVVPADLLHHIRTEGGRYFVPRLGQGFIPVEFADAAYRFGHAQIREEYRINRSSDPRSLFPDLVGFGPVFGDRQVEWPMLFDMPGHPPAQPVRRLGPTLTPGLLRLPEAITGQVRDVAHQSLAVRDLLRGTNAQLPSGEAVADLLGVPSLASLGFDTRSAGATPLWLYVLHESEHTQRGRRLGPVGGTIVAEVLFGLLQADPESYLVTDPGWRPSLPTAGAMFGLSDLLRFANEMASGSN